MSLSLLELVFASSKQLQLCMEVERMVIIFDQRILIDAKGILQSLTNLQKLLIGKIVSERIHLILNSALYERRLRS